MSFASFFRRLTAMVLMTSVVSIVYANSERTSLNSIYAEGLGPGLAYSFNYERLVINDLGVRVGMSYLSFSVTTGTSTDATNTSGAIMFFPITASYIGVSGGAHCLELGLGSTLIYAAGSVKGMGVNVSSSGMMALGNMLVGYRIHPVKGGFQFRIGFCGLYGNGLSVSDTGQPAFGFLPWFYISLGGCF